ncbi:hypothetical protein [Luteimonas sp. R10]|uniref:hypothetical protein n=1 Tax=Luteimonas sp. R10 TaxID=3108176 RepID=UPI00308CEBB9|nr:hypothetical protein U3649_06490 [Luteimonas sp. R10]
MANDAVLPRPGGRRTWMCGVFRPSQDGESENPRNNETLGLLRQGRPFSLVRFFWASKRNEPARASVRKLLPLLDSRVSKYKLQSFHSLRERVTFLCWPKEKSPKEMASSTEQTNCRVLVGIFRLAILARSENGGHHARRPPGLDDFDVVRHP